MRRSAWRGGFGFALLSLAAVALCAALGMAVYNEVKDIRRTDADNLLASFQQTIELKLKGGLGETGDLVAALEVDPSDEAWLPAAADALLARDEVVGVLYVVDDTMRYAFPESDFGNMVGRDLSQFTYVFTLAKYTDGFVVEGPVTLENGVESFVFVEPVDVDGAYHGEVAVALKADFVIEQLDLSLLEQGGYLYELWAVSPQDGRKDVIAVSDGGHDFSHAAKATFGMPSEWTLSVMPADGWVPGLWTAAIVAVATAISLLLVGLMFLGERTRRMERCVERAKRTDQETGMYNFDGFVEMLEKERLGPDSPLTLICATVDDFEETSTAMGRDARQEYLGKVLGEIDAAVRGNQVGARVGCGTFAVAIRGRVGKQVLVDTMRSLELALMWKVRAGDRKAFCRARSAAVYYPEDGDDLVALLERTIKLLDRDKPEGFGSNRRRRK